MISRGSEPSGMRVWLLLDKPSRRMEVPVNEEMNLERALQKEDNITYSLGTLLVHVPPNRG